VTHRASSVQTSISPAWPVVPVAATVMSVFELPLYPNATQSWSLPSSCAKEKWSASGVAQLAAHGACGRALLVLCFE
jgi:hypothetical protein